MCSRGCSRGKLQENEDEQFRRLIAIGLCTLHFVCGYWLAQTRTRKQKRRPHPTSAPEVDRVAFQAAVNTLLEQALQVCTSGDKLDLAELGRAAKAVERSASSFDFQPKELRSLTMQPDGTPLASDGSLWTERRPYPTWQYLAPFGDSLPDPKDFPGCLLPRHFGWRNLLPCDRSTDLWTGLHHGRLSTQLDCAGSNSRQLQVCGIQRDANVSGRLPFLTPIGIVLGSLAGKGACIRPASLGPPHAEHGSVE
jgi:hypothetical protein